jgi:hypothetical protein
MVLVDLKQKRNTLINLGRQQLILTVTSWMPTLVLVLMYLKQKKNNIIKSLASVWCVIVPVHHGTNWIADGPENDSSSSSTRITPQESTFSFGGENEWRPY